MMNLYNFKSDDMEFVLYDDSNIKHKELLDELFSDKGVVDNVSITKDRLLETANNVKKNNINIDYYAGIIKKDDNYIGIYKLRPVANRFVFYEVAIENKFRGNHYAALSDKALLNYLFQPGSTYEKVILDIDIFNQGSIKSALKAGFKSSGKVEKLELTDRVINYIEFFKSNPYINTSKAFLNNPELFEDQNNKISNKK